MRQLWLFTLKKKKPQGDLAEVFLYFKSSFKKDGDKICSRTCCNWTRGNAFKQKMAQFCLDIRKRFFYKYGEKLEQIVRRSCGFPRNIQGHMGRGSEQLNQVEDVTAPFQGGWKS